MSGPSAMLAVAAVAVALALQISSGTYDAVALALVTVACALAVWGAHWRRRSARPENAILPQAALGLGCTAGLVCSLFFNPTLYGDPRSFQGGFHGFVLMSLVVLSAYLCIHLRASLIRARFLLLLACFAVMGVVVVRASPTPAGDVRFLLLALMIGSAWLLARALPGVTGELAALLLLFQPRAFLVLEQGWTEPVVAFSFALTVFALARRAHWALAGGALGLLAASMLYSRLVPSRQPFQADSLSLASLWLRQTGRALPSLLGAASGAVVLLLCLRPRPGVAVACAAAAAAWAAVLIWNQQAFCNDWWLGSGLLGAAAAASGNRETA